MNQIELGPIDSVIKTDLLSREDLVEMNELLRSELLIALREIYKLKNQNLTETQLNLLLEEQLKGLRQEIYGSSSERLKDPKLPSKKKSPSEPRVRRPSERYPQVPVREVCLTLESPSCNSCGKVMSDSGMTEDSEQLTVIPKKFEIVRYKRSVYRCSCQSCMKTAELPVRILEGSSYSDEMILDVALSKYCDLIPMERYVQMAGRSGVMDIPPNSLIDLTHKLALFVKGAYWLIEEGCLQSRVLRADETPHRML